MRKEGFTFLLPIRGFFYASSPRTVDLRKSLYNPVFKCSFQMWFKLFREERRGGPFRGKSYRSPLKGKLKSWSVSAVALLTLEGGVIK